MEKIHILNRERNKALEIDARYKDEKKTRQILNELLTNSMKYAAQKGRQLLIDIQLKPCQDGFYLHYKDNGPGFPEGQIKDREGGLGAYLLKSMSRQLRGTLETRNDGGATYAVYFQEKNTAA